MAEHQFRKELKAMARHYADHHRADASAELDPYRDIPFEEAVQKAALSRRPDGLVHSHQRRWAPVLPEAEKHLTAYTADLNTANTFAELIAIVDRAVRPVRGIADLAIYDFALRIGANLSLSPSVVYLHAGTREGSRQLARLLGLDPWRRTIPRVDLPKAWHSLTPGEAEDVLCHNAEVLRGLADSLPVDWSNRHCGNSRCGGRHPGRGAAC